MSKNKKKRNKKGFNSYHIVFDYEGDPWWKHRKYNTYVEASDREMKNVIHYLDNKGLLL